uniref:Uncharacterized protein n=1 Tax=Arundo donax TaxID=35708 RepID=A0A0A9GRI1_ARUDO
MMQDGKTGVIAIPYPYTYYSPQPPAQLNEPKKRFLNCLLGLGSPFPAKYTIQLLPRRPDLLVEGTSLVALRPRRDTMWFSPHPRQSSCPMYMRTSICV